ncbi:MAG TPA: helix-turn-helix transcriptional regulator [Blastocatellia bacterium]|nr:helix-turn-helix transcriptional regulator [Blastocatellia bacterium]HMV87198.1 helix-turn-helix transcriptional regulator [Blastocatellia bacterium]HMX25552.1 helix-turn-helix transcriptional regulator [Blastocatellia bacterium]HMY70286.1 helix-turn-helix transcriptional regulator [Blastocatellia bacterium]HMZ18843.1 helix-turn-helix transcriptional regulator [Blastocatellia bacterium]
MSDFLPTPDESLAQFVRRVRLANKWTLKDVERQSSGQIDDSHVSMIETGKVLNPSAAKLMALADGLKLRREAISNFVFGQPEPLTPNEEELLSAYRATPEETRRYVLLVAKALRDAPALHLDEDIGLDKSKSNKVKAKTKQHK